jgi:hypothetical protein
LGLRKNFAQKNKRPFLPENKFMRILHFTPAIIILATLTFSGCYFKKGEDDPLMSLRSRKARVVGEWNIDLWKREKSGDGSSQYLGDSSASSFSREFKIEAGIVNYTYKSESVNESPVYTYEYSYSGPVSAKIIFKDDGTFERTISNQNSNFSASGSDGYSSSGTYSFTEKISGTWNFLGGVQDDYKNMERIILNYNKIENSEIERLTNGLTYEWTNQYNYSDGQNTDILQLTTLRNKEMKFTGTADYSDLYDEVHEGEKISSGNSTNKEKLTGTFSQ